MIKKTISILILLNTATASLGAYAAPADSYFIPKDVWTGTYRATCNNKTISGNATMNVLPLSVVPSTDGPYSYNTEYFTGILKTENLPADCLNIDLANGIPLEKGTSAKEFSIDGINWAPYPDLTINTGSISPTSAELLSYVSANITYFSNGNNVSIELFAQN